MNRWICRTGLVLVLSFAASGAWAALSPQELETLRTEAEAGDALSQYRLGRFYAEKNPTEAMRWYRKAAEQGQPDAQTAMGFAYLDGKGLAKDEAKDEAKAAAWYEKAARQGEKLAQWQLAWMSLEGRGVPASEDEALHWYEAVIATDRAENGGEDGPMSRMARDGIADIYSRRSARYEVGLGAPRDPALGYFWLSRAAEIDPKLYGGSLAARARALSAEQRDAAEKKILEWAAGDDHGGGPQAFAQALAALHAAAKKTSPDPKKDPRRR